MPWLQDNDMLPDIIPEGRIFTYDYNANYTEAPVETLLGHADTLLNLIHYERTSVKFTLSFIDPIITEYRTGSVDPQASNLYCFLLWGPCSCRGMSSVTPSSF